MGEAPRTLSERLEWARRQSVSPSQDWTGYCQMFVRMDAGVPALFGSAWAQWLGADDEDKHPGGAPSDAPLGSLLCWKGSGPYGHIAIAARPFKNGVPACWSNDLVKYGDIDKAARHAPVSQWNQPYLGYVTSVNDFDLKFPTPKPKQNKRYESVDKAVTRLEVARETARKQGDKKDAETLTVEIQRLKRLYDQLRRY